MKSVLAAFGYQPGDEGGVVMEAIGLLAPQNEEEQRRPTFPEAEAPVATSSMTENYSKKLGVTSLTIIMFYKVSGGPFGAEGVVRSGGVFFALVGFLVAPLLWAVPEAYMSAELACAFPESAGRLAWIEHAFGPAVGWQAGFLSWVAGATDNAIYPVLFLDYLLQVVSADNILRRGALNPIIRFVYLSGTSIALAFINWLGLELVGNMSTTICFIAMSPFIILSVVGALQVQPHRWLQMPLVPEYDEMMVSTSEETTAGTFQLMAIGLGSVLWRPFLNGLFWNLNSVDSVGNFAGDVAGNIGKVIPRAVYWTVIMTVAAYFIPLLVAVGASDSTQQDWVDGYWARVATDVVGTWLGAWLVFSAALSNIALFQAELSSDAFQLAGMAERGYLPKFFQFRSRFGTPTAGIVVGTAMIVTLCTTSDLMELVECLNFNYAISLMMEYAAFIKLRLAQPHLSRPYRVPLGTAGCIWLFTPPMVLTMIILAVATRKTVLFSIGANLVGMLIYFIAHYRSSLFPYQATYTPIEDIEGECNGDNVNNGIA